MTFVLHPNLSTKPFIIDLPLCRVLLENNQHYPWLFLVPRKNHLAKMMDLNVSDQGQVMQEIDQAQKVLWTLFNPTQINVAAIGNKTPQLHVHVIARFADDPAWPGTVWDHPAAAPYANSEKEKIIQKLSQAFS